MEEKVQEKIKEFDKKYSVPPEYVKLGWGLNNLIFKDNDKLCGLTVRIDDNNSSIFEVGISL